MISFQIKTRCFVVVVVVVLIHKEERNVEILHDRNDPPSRLLSNGIKPGLTVTSLDYIE